MTAEVTPRSAAWLKVSSCLAAPTPLHVRSTGRRWVLDLGVAFAQRLFPSMGTLAFTFLGVPPVSPNCRCSAMAFRLI